jgi:hypothetical protein
MVDKVSEFRRFGDYCRRYYNSTRNYGLDET